MAAMKKKFCLLLIVLAGMLIASPARAAVDTYRFWDLLRDDDVEGMRTTLTELTRQGLASGDLPDLSPQVRSSAMLSLLLDAGMTVDRQALHAFTPPEFPAEATKCLKLLIGAGAEVDAPGFRGETPLTLLAARTHAAWPETASSVVKTLLDAGADPNAKGDDAEPPLFAWRNRSPECVRLLLAAGARTDAVREGATVLHNFGSSQPPEEAAETVRLLLAAGADPDAAHQWTRATPLATLRENARSVPVVKALLDAGAKADARDSSGTPLLFGWLEDSPEIVRLLLDAGADVNTPDSDGATPLIRLASRERSSPRKSEMIRLLLAAGAKADARDRSGRSALLICGDTLNPEDPQWDLAILEALLDAGADPNVRDTCGSVLFLSWLRSSPECVRLLLNAGARVDVRSSEGKTALHYAVLPFRGRMEIVRMLLAAGAPADLPDDEGRTPLMDAASVSERRGDARELLRLLLEAGARLDARDSMGNTPLMYWIRTSPECVALLLERGADPDAADEAGRTPLYLAVVHDRPEAAALLADAGADLHVRIEGRNLADLAHRYGADETLRFLESRGIKRSLRSYLPEPDVLRKIALGVLLWMGSLLAWGLTVAAASWIVFRKPPEWLRAFGVALGIQLPFLLMVMATGEADAVAWDVAFYLLTMLLAWTGGWPAIIAGGGLLAFYYVALFRFILRRPTTRQRPTWGWAFLLAALALALFVALSWAVPFGDRYFVQNLFGL